MNCGQVIIHKETISDEVPNTTDFGYTKSFGTDPTSTNTFTLQDDGAETFENVLFGSGYRRRGCDPDELGTGPCRLQRQRGSSVGNWIRLDEPQAVLSRCS
jgi:hypothetical protein